MQNVWERGACERNREVEEEPIFLFVGKGGKEKGHSSVCVAVCGRELFFERYCVALG